MTTTKGASFKGAPAASLSRLLTPLRKMALGVVLGLTVIAMSACNGGAKQAITEPAAAPTSKVQDEASKEVPADLYAGMPIYPGAEIQHVRKPKGAMREIVFQLKNSPPLDQMVNFYKDGLKKGDFKITSMLIMRGRKTWSCDFHKDGRPGSVMLYHDDNGTTSTTIDLFYEVPSNTSQALLDPKEEFDIVGPAEPAAVTPSVQNVSQEQDKPNKAKRN